MFDTIFKFLKKSRSRFYSNNVIRIGVIVPYTGNLTHNYTYFFTFFFQNYWYSSRILLSLKLFTLSNNNFYFLGYALFFKIYVIISI